MQLLTSKCPKCGYMQEERPDCVRCGVVFSKYYALYPPAGQPEGQEDMTMAYPPAPETQAAELSEIRQALREVMRRLNDVEFERAERNLLRAETKALEQKYQELFDQLSKRVQALENSKPDESSDKLHQELLGKELVDIAEHLERTDGRLDGILAELEGQSARLSDQAHAVAERMGSFEEKLGTAAAPASEIEDLRETLGLLEAQVKSLRQTFESPRSQPADGAAARIAQVEAEVTALRGENRETLRRYSERAAEEDGEMQRLRAQVEALQRTVETLANAPQPEPPPDLRHDMRAIIDSLDQVRGLMQVLAQRLQPQSAADPR